MKPKSDDFNRICKVCGFTWGSHRAGPEEFRNQCPLTEAGMDWDNNTPTFFVDSGKKLELYEEG